MSDLEHDMYMERRIKRQDEIERRKDILNKNFEWSEKNVAHMKKLFKHVTGLRQKMLNNIVTMKKDFLQVVACGIDLEKNFAIRAYVSLRRGIKFPYADDCLLSMMEYVADFDFELSGIAVMAHREERPEEDILMTRLNWNIEIFDYFRKRDDKDPYIPYTFHTVWQDGYVYSLEDLLYIEPEDFIIHKEVSF